MKIELWVAIVTGLVALTTAAGTILSSIRISDRSAKNAKDIEQLKIENERTKVADEQQKEMSNYIEPLARSCYDLQSRLYNILKRQLIQVYFLNGNDREKAYVINNTTFLVGQYLCWTEIVRREIQFIDLGESDRTRDLLCLQDAISNTWGTDEFSPSFRLFAGEQRAIGEALITTSARGQECMGYGAFLRVFAEGVNPLIDSIRADVAALSCNFKEATSRLTILQNKLIDLLTRLDQKHIRFPKNRTTKV